MTGAAPGNSSSARAVGSDESAGERGPAVLVRTENFAGIAVEVFVEEEVVAPGGTALEERRRAWAEESI